MMMMMMMVLSQGNTMRWCDLCKDKWPPIGESLLGNFCPKCHIINDIELKTLKRRWTHVDSWAILLSSVVVLDEPGRFLWSGKNPPARLSSVGKPKGECFWFQTSIPERLSSFVRSNSDWAMHFISGDSSSLRLIIHDNPHATKPVIYPCTKDPWQILLGTFWLSSSREFHGLVASMDLFGILVDTG